MKEIIIVRHAKSDWGFEFLRDIDRHLNERGYSDAYMLSQWYKKNHKAPDLILSSPATRSLSTALIFARALEVDTTRFELEERIYEATSEKLLTVLREQKDTQQSLLLFGHNPGLTDLCNRLSDDLYFDNIPTCGICGYSFNIKTWSELAPKKGKLNFYQFPKDYKIKD